MCWTNIEERKFMKHRWGFFGPAMKSCCQSPLTEEERLNQLKEYKKYLEDEIKRVEEKIRKMERR